MKKLFFNCYLAVPQQTLRYSREDSLTNSMLFYLNVLSCEAISGNNTATIPDHLPQFFLLPMCFQILFAINQISWEETGQNVTKKILFLIILIKIGLNSPT